MAKYIFTRKENFRPAGSSHLGVTFEKGDVVEGTLVANTKVPGSFGFVEVNTPQGKISIPIGSTGIVASAIVPYSGEVKAMTVATPNKEIFTPKNIIIGILVIGGIIGGLKLAKVF